MKTKITLIAIGIAAGLLSGCATTGGHGSKLESEAKKTGDNLNAVETQITNVIASLENMVAPEAPLQEIYPTFCKQVKQIAKSADALKKESMAMKAVGAERFETWKLETANIQNEKMRKDSIKLMEDAMKEHEKLLKLLDESETLMDPLVADLNDIMKFLELQLTPKSVKEIAGQMRSVSDEGAKVIEWIAEVREKLAAR